MNIAFLTHTSNYYGANRSLAALISELHPFRAKAFLIAPEEGDATRRLGQMGVRVAIIPGIRAFRSMENRNTSFSYSNDDVLDPFTDHRNANTTVIEKLVAQLGEWQIHLIYSNSSIISAGAKASRILELPHIWHLREFGDLDYNREPLEGWHNTRSDITRANATISVSNAVRRHLCTDPDDDNNFVIDNGVFRRKTFDSLYKLRKQRADSLSRLRPFTFVLVGRIQHGKGQHTAIKALSILKKNAIDARLIMVGGGETSALQALASRLGVSDLVCFRGYVDEPIREMLGADALLMCSRFEAFGRVTAEAMGTGLAVIGRNSGGTPELIHHGINGMLYSGGHRDLANCMLQLATDRNRSREIGAEGWIMARKRFSIEQYASSVWDVISAHGRKASSPAPAPVLRAQAKATQTDTQ